MAALRWLIDGFGYEFTSGDVFEAYNHAMKAAKNAGHGDEAFDRIRKLVAAEGSGERFVSIILGRELGLPETRGRRSTIA